LSGSGECSHARPNKPGKVGKKHMQSKAGPTKVLLHIGTKARGLLKPKTQKVWFGHNRGLTQKSKRGGKKEFQA